MANEPETPADTNEQSPLQRTVAALEKSVAALQKPEKPIHTVFRTSENVADLIAAFIEAQKKFTAPAKSRKGKVQGQNAAGQRYEYEYLYAPLDEVLNATKTAMLEQGVTLTHDIRTLSKDEVAITPVLLHKSGQVLVLSTVVFASGGTIQKTGGAITYGRRYTTTSVLNVASEEDDDAAQVNGAQTRAQGQSTGQPANKNRRPVQGAPTRSSGTASTAPGAPAAPAAEPAPVPESELPASNNDTAAAPPPELPELPVPAPPFITTPQKQRFKSICGVHGVTQGQLKRFLKGHGITSLDVVPQTHYDALVRSVQEGDVNRA